MVIGDAIENSEESEEHVTGMNEERCLLCSGRKHGGICAVVLLKT